MSDVTAASRVFPGCRRAALLCVVPAIALLAPAPPAAAQRLLTLVSGAEAAASVGGLGPSIGPVPTAVQVDLELLRSAPARLEVPTPAGGVLSAQRSVFEDRGGGDLMWSGGQPDAGYDTVVLTVEGGRLVGRFGAAGGGVYQIHAGGDGRGGMAPLVGPQPDGPVPFCGVEAGAEDFHDGLAHVASDAPPADPPERVSNPQSHDRLDILVAYTATAAENWAYLGGPEAAIRHAVDILKMVFRNNRIEVEPHLLHIAQASAALDRAGRDLGRHLYGSFPLEKALRFDGDLLRLHHEYRADLLHLFTGEPTVMLGACGVHSQAGDPARPHRPRYFTMEGWTTNHPLHCWDYTLTFVHEVGHGLGAHHDPPNASGWTWRPYAFGHTDLEVMPSLGTVMSYRGQREPIFSTPRIRPYGAILGIADARDNERMLQESVHVAVRYDDHLLPPDIPAPPSDLRVRFDGVAAHLTWRNNAPDADGHEVTYFRPTGSGRKVKIAGARSKVVLPLDLRERVTHYEFFVRATRGHVRSLRSNGVLMVIPGEPIAAPSDVSVAAYPSGEFLGIHWTDNSDDESGFDVQLLQDGDPIHRERVPADSERVRIDASWVSAKHGAEYGVRVFAYNSSGYSESSEVAAFRWEPANGRGPVTGVSVRATGPTSVRVAWNAMTSEYHVYASLRNWESRRRIRRSSGDGGTLWTDFVGLVRGGRYVFYLAPTSGMPQRFSLTLGERGTGPRAPSEVAWVLEGNRVRLSWKDNSNDELGFEVQSGSLSSAGLVAGVRGPTWERLLTVPADTESAVSDIAFPVFEDGYVFRVFAYNDRGYSRASARSGSCRAGEEALCLQDSRFHVTVNWWTADGERGVGRAVQEGTDDSGLFQFFGPENWEILIKVLDGCRVNGRMWVLAASTTNLGYRINVVDTIAHESRSYRNEPGQPAPAIVDTEAFSVACVDGAVP